MGHDILFIKFIRGLFIIMILYGAGMICVVIWADLSLASRMIAGFSAMFAAVVGLGSGYLLGAQTTRPPDVPEAPPPPATTTPTRRTRAKPKPKAEPPTPDVPEEL